MTFARRYVAAIGRWRFVVLLLGAGALALGGAYGVSLFSHTGSSGSAPAGADSVVAGAALSAAFPSLVGTTSVTVVLSSDRVGGVVSAEYVAFMLELNASVHSFIERPSFDSYVTAPPCVRAAFVDATNTTTFATVTARERDGDTSKHLLAFTEAAIARARGGHAVDRVVCTGGPAFSRDTNAGLLSDLARMDSIAFPLAFAVLAVVLRSVRFLVVPLATVLIAVSISFSIMVPIAVSWISVVSFAPSVMASAAIAMSTDYSLFLLSRFREETLAQAARSPGSGGGAADRPLVAAALELVMATAARTVLVSGSTLALCFAGLAWFKMAMLRSTGIGASIAVATCVVVSLSGARVRHCRLHARSRACVRRSHTHSHDA